MRRVGGLFGKNRNHSLFSVISRCFANSKNEILETLVKKKKVKFDSLSPYQRWLAFGNGYERPFTGMYWDTMNVGSYHCSTCSNELFKSDHKYLTPSGMATFWDSLKGSTTFENDPNIFFDKTNLIIGKYKDAEPSDKRIKCSKCESNLGILFLDGPPPKFWRMSINSGSINFTPKGVFTNPNILKKERKKKFEKEKAKKERKKKLRIPFDQEKYREVVEMSNKEK